MTSTSSRAWIIRRLAAAALASLLIATPVEAYRGVSHRGFLAVASTCIVAIFIARMLFFVAMRVAYIYCYVADRATLRSLVWCLGLAAAVRLYVLAL